MAIRARETFRFSNFPMESATRRPQTKSRSVPHAVRSSHRAAPSLTCARATALIGSYLSGDLRARERRAFESHQGACPDCLGFSQTYKKTVELTRSFLLLHRRSRPLEIAPLNS